MTEMCTKGSDEAAGMKRPKIGRLDSRQEAPQQLCDEEAEAAKGGFQDRSVTSASRMNRSGVSRSSAAD
jgi:hypothetical protein